MNKLMEKNIVIAMPLKKWVSVLGIVQHHMDTMLKRDNIEEINNEEEIIKIISAYISNSV